MLFFVSMLFYPSMVYFFSTYNFPLFFLPIGGKILVHLILLLFHLISFNS